MKYLITNSVYIYVLNNSKCIFRFVTIMLNKLSLLKSVETNYPKKGIICVNILYFVRLHNQWTLNNWLPGYNCGRPASIGCQDRVWIGEDVKMKSTANVEVRWKKH